MGTENNDPIFSEEQLANLGGSETIQGGKFYETLKQNAKQIKESQATRLAEDLEFALRNVILESKNKLRAMYSAKDCMIDQFLPNQTTSLKIAEGFDANKFATDFTNYNLEIRNLSIRLDAALRAYKELMGKEFKG